ncbi:NAD-dependent epimerase [Corallincola luteus]|uniref:NAD-dependent epimerase n=1 Tax=Corallincola luteus TaxID=1775177 RepID=A0ABY2AHS9_9GAMM|nr:NAD-dependent epimerase [Corallincola luteus]TCI01571.1 NAD-dependent epimerase [Corallincola luteus]
MKFLVTGAAGFIGFHTSMRLCNEGHEVVGLDIVNDYYDVNLKLDRLRMLDKLVNFRHVRVALEDRDGIAKLFANEKFDRVIHLAAQAGVRYSLEHPFAYTDANITGTLTILEGCRHNDVEHLVYASSSSVYGLNTTMPFATHNNVDHPVSLYAATKKANELMAHTYSHLYGMPTTGLRFFTVYGPWGRPDMALFLFTKAILEGKPIDVYNHGKMQRDFTYVDDIVEGIVRIQDQPAAPNSSWSGAAPQPHCSSAPYKVFNIGNHQPVELEHFITCIEKALGMEAERNYMPIQPGDVPATYADIEDLNKSVGFHPSTPIETGIQNFVDWYRDYYQV